MKINYSIPATISDFSEGKNPYLTYAKLRVFYIGETGDKRLFTQSFAEKLITTLPQVPVIGYYDEDSEDFLGHNSTQYVYGYVPETTELEFEEKNGKTYALTDVVLFTGKEGNIGDVAKKIEGKQQSLELDPNTIKYKVNRNKFGKLKNIEFTDGAINGLSVLGDNQTPAFRGSEFFTAGMTDEELVAAFVNLEKESERSEGGADMDLKKVFEFMRETYTEKIQKVIDAYQEHTNNYFWVLQIGEDAMVIYNYDDNTGNSYYYRVEYSEGEDGYSFSEPVEVKARYLTEEEINNTFEEKVEVETEVKTEEITNHEEKEDEKEGEEDEEEFVKEDEKEDEDEEDKTDMKKDEDEKKRSKCEVSEESESTEESTEDSVSQEEFETQAKELEELSSRNKELEDKLNSYELKEKESLLAKYSELLTADQTKDFKEKLNEIAVEDLEKELKLATYDANIEAKQQTVFAATLPKANKKQNKKTDKQLIAEYL